MFYLSNNALFGLFFNLSDLLLITYRFLFFITEFLCEPVYVSEFIYASRAFALFFLFVLWFVWLFVCLPICFLKKEKEDVELDNWGDAKDLGRDEGEETMIKIFYLRNISFQLTKKNGCWENPMFTCRRIKLDLILHSVQKSTPKE